METNEKKYGFTGETKKVGNKVLHRIVALRDVPRKDRLATPIDIIKKGTKGGYIEKESNLSQDGSCWVDDVAYVCDEAKVVGDAYLCEYAVVQGNALVRDRAFLSACSVVGDKAVITDNAIVGGNCTVNENATVGGNARVDEEVHIHGNSVIFGNASVSGNAEIYDNACIGGNAKVTDNAQVFEDAQIMDTANVYDYAKVYGHALVSNSASVLSNAEVFDYAKISSNAQVYGNAKVCGNACLWGSVSVCENATVRGNVHLYDNTRVCGNACLEGMVKTYGNQLFMEGTFKNSNDLFDRENLGKKDGFSLQQKDSVENSPVFLKKNKRKLTDKYKLIPDKENPQEYYQLVALRNFGDVRANEVGGRVSGEYNLSQKGNCWIYDGMTVTGNARVEGDARVLPSTFMGITHNNVVCRNALIKDNAVVVGGYVCDNAVVCGNAHLENAIVKKDARIEGRASVFYSTVSDKAVVGENASVGVYSEIAGNASVKGYASVKGVNVTGNAKIDGNAFLDVTQLDEHSPFNLLTVKDDAHITGKTHIEFEGEFIKNHEFMAVIGKDASLSDTFISNVNEMKLFEKELDIKQNRVLDKNAVVTGIALSFEKCTPDQIYNAMTFLFYEEGNDFEKKFKAEKLADDVYKNGLVLTDTAFKDNHLFDNGKITKEQMYEKNDFVGVDSPDCLNFKCSLKQSSTNIPGELMVESEYYMSDETGKDMEISLEELNKNNNRVVHLDACKLALYFEERFGMEIVLRDMEYGKVNKKGNFVEFQSQVRPQWAEEFNRKHKRMRLGKKDDVVKSKADSYTITNDHSL